MAKKRNVYTMEASPKSLPEFVRLAPAQVKEYFVLYEMFSCKYSPDYKIYNGYGLSEAGGCLCFKEIEKDYDIVPAGKFAELENASIKCLQIVDKILGKIANIE